MRFDKTPEPSQLIVEEPKIAVINFGFKIINKTVFYFFTGLYWLLPLSRYFYVILYYLHLFCDVGLRCSSVFWPPNCNKPHVFITLWIKEPTSNRNEC